MLNCCLTHGPCGEVDEGGRRDRELKTDFLKSGSLFANEGTNLIYENGEPIGVSKSHPTLAGCVRCTSRLGALLLTMFVMMFAVVGKELVDSALSAGIVRISEYTGVDSVEGTLPGVGTGMYAAGKCTGILVASWLGGRRCLLLVTFVGIVTPLVFRDRFKHSK